MSIYQDVLDIEELIDSDEDIQVAEELRQEVIELGIEKLCKVRANILSDIEGLKAEKKRIDDSIKRNNSNIERLEKYILYIHGLTGEKKTVAGSFTVSTRKSTSVDICEGFNNEAYQTIEQVIKIDKMAIKKALGEGITIEGASLIEKDNLQVK